MSVSVAQLSKFQFNWNDAPIVGGLLFTYAAGTTTKLTTYQDSFGAVPNTNPIVLDANGQCNLYLTDGLSYKFTLSPPGDTDPPTNPYWTIDNIVSASALAAALASTTDPTQGAGIVGFNPTLNYATNTIGWGAEIAASAINVLRYIPPANWAATLNGTSTYDGTAAIQSAINSISMAGTVYLPGLWNISSTLLVNGLLRNVHLVGDGGSLSISNDGQGTQLNTASILNWIGPNNGIMLLLDSISGSTVSRLKFKTDMPTQDVISITGVIGIQYINKSICRYSSINNCGFAGLAKCIQFFDDGSNPSSDTNMDTHSINDCEFIDYITGVEVDQSNVYGSLCKRCAFYGSTVYSQYHVNVLKGHMSLMTCYLGPMKDGASVGGKNGIALHVGNGFLNGYDLYGECHNAPFFVWDADTLETSISCTFSGCIILNSTASLPTTYNLLNSTNNNVIIEGGRIAGNVKQALATTGSIVFFGTAAAAVDATGNTDGVSYVGAYLSGYAGPMGTMGTGIGTLIGSAPEINFALNPAGTEIKIKNTADVLGFTRPGLANGPKMDFTKSQLNLQDAVWTINLGSNGKNSVTLNTGAATTVVPNTSVLADSVILLTPKTAAAASLTASAAAPYISSISAGVSFTIATANATTAPAGCTFNWAML